MQPRFLWIAGAAGLALTLPALATGLPMSTIPLPARRAHAIHASMPAFACCGVAFFICSEADTVD